MSEHEWLSGLLTRKQEDGTLKFSAREVEDLVGAVVLSAGFTAGTLPPRVEQAVAALIERAELDPAEDLPVRAARLDAYFARAPLPPELLADFRRALRSESTESSEASPLDGFRSFLDEPDARRARTEGEPRPAGTRPGGALGFHLAKGDLSPKK